MSRKFNPRTPPCVGSRVINKITKQEGRVIALSGPSYFIHWKSDSIDSNKPLVIHPYALNSLTKVAQRDDTMVRLSTGI